MVNLDQLIDKIEKHDDGTIIYIHSLLPEDLDFLDKIQQKMYVYVFSVNPPETETHVVLDEDKTSEELLVSD